jgi:hypothetical protein
MDNYKSPIPNPQSPIPNPQSPIKFKVIKLVGILNKINIKLSENG